MLPRNLFAELLIGFLAVVPLLRRQFATFSPAERRQIWQRVCRGSVMPEVEVGFEGDRADAVLPLVGQLLGLSGEGRLIEASHPSKFCYSVWKQVRSLQNGNV